VISSFRKSYSLLSGSRPIVTDDLASLLVIYAKGLCMGMADAVPGVSGGTVALVLGIYDRLVGAISEFSVANAVVVLGALRTPRTLREDDALRAVLDRLDVPFLAALGGGAFTAVLVLTRVVTWAKDANPAAMFALFVGLIGASGLILVREVRPFDRTEGAAFVTGIACGAAASEGVAIGSGHSLPVIFLAGMIALSAMVMPGISGSLLLVVLGQYTYLSETLTVFTDDLAALVTGETSTIPIAAGTTVVVFVAGGVIGIATIARLVNAALERNRSVTIALLVGLVIGALRAPMVRVDQGVDAWTVETSAVVAGFVLVGIAVVVCIDRYLYRIEV
jgi:putative membrane protein